MIGEKLLDRNGKPVGKITDVVVVSATLENEWITVKTGMMGGEHLVPYACIGDGHGDAIAAPLDKDEIKTAPVVDKGQLNWRVSRAKAASTAVAGPWSPSGLPTKDVGNPLRLVSQRAGERIHGRPCKCMSAHEPT